jgi:hypothetical protein
MRETNVHTRESDGADGAHQVITIDRKIPLPWLLSIAGGLALVLAGMWYQLQRTTETAGDIKVDVKAIRDDMQKRERKDVDDDYAMRDLAKRVTVLEATLQAQRDQQTKGGR